DLRGVVRHANGLGVPGEAGAHRLVFGAVGRATRVARHSIDHSLRVLEYSLDAPEASASEDRGFRLLPGHLVDINESRWEFHNGGGSGATRRAVRNEQGHGEHANANGCAPGD